MFDGLAARYDLLNSLMTATLHRRWRKRAVDRVELASGNRVLDVCCGTGDLTLEMAGRASGTELIGCDFSEPMLSLAREKAVHRGIRWVRFEHADALRLPYANASFDAATIGFALRNLADTNRGLTELARVLRPGGRVVVLTSPVLDGSRSLPSTRSGSIASCQSWEASPRTQVPIPTSQNRCVPSMTRTSSLRK
jgi:demethylmenaquinone methyltransferase/2-methoxy-6-polyprenyl-1,4-benzoquinol methylase